LSAVNIKVAVTPLACWRCDTPTASGTARPPAIRNGDPYVETQIDGVKKPIITCMPCLTAMIAGATDLPRPYLKPETPAHDPSIV
jgi:hypothetical protein